MSAPPLTPRPVAGPSLLGEGCAIGVATSGYQVEGGYNGDGEPHNNWSGWEDVGRGRAFRRRVRLLAAAGGGAGPCRGDRLQRLPALGGMGAARAGAGRLRRGGPRALRRDPRSLHGPGPRARRHAAPLHAPVVARRGVLAAARVARRLRPARGPGRAGAGALLPALGDDQRAQHRDAHGLDRGGQPARAPHGRHRCLLRARQPPHRSRARRRRRDGHPGRRRGHDQHQLVVGLRARPHAPRPAATARGRYRPRGGRQLRGRASGDPRRRVPAGACRGGGHPPFLRRRVALRHRPRARARRRLGAAAHSHAAAGAAPCGGRRAGGGAAAWASTRWASTGTTRWRATP